MKRAIKYFTLFLAAVSVFASCDKDDAMKQSGMQGGEESLITISDTELPPLGDGDCVFGFYSQEGWKIEGIPSWLDITPSSGRKGGNSIKIKSKQIGDSKTYTNNLRTCDIRIVSDSGQELQKFTVSQHRPYVHTKMVTANAISFPNNGKITFAWNEYGQSAPFTIEVDSNVEWNWALGNENRFIVKKEAAKASGSAYDKKHIVTIIPAFHNFDKAPLFAEFVLTGLDLDGKSLDPNMVNYYRTSWNLEQKNLRFLLDDSPETPTLDMGELIADYRQYDDGKPARSMYVSTEIPWSDIVVDNPASSWIKVDRSVKDSLYYLNAIAVNQTGVTRQSEISLNAKVDGENVSRKIVVTQLPYTLDVTFSEPGASIVIGNDDHEKRTAQVSTKGPWKVEYDANWLTLNTSANPDPTPSTKFDNLGAGSISFYAPNQNLDFSDRSVYVKVTGIDGVRVEKNVIHNKFIFDIVPPASIKTISTLGSEGVDEVVAVNCSGGWEISNASSFDWIKYYVNGEEGKTSGLASDKQFSIQVPGVNPDFDHDRDARLILTSLNHKSAGIQATREVDVKQLRYIWEIEYNGKSEGIVYSPNAYEKEGQGYPLIIRCSGSWTLEGDPDWFVPSKKAGSRVATGETIYFKPVNNLTPSTKSATIHVKDGYGHDAKTINVVQDGFVFKIVNGQQMSFSNIPVMAARDGNSYDISFEHTTDSPYMLSTESGWITSSVKSVKANGKTQITTLSAVAANNGNLSSRSQKVTLTSVLDSKDIAYFTFAQLPYEFDSTPVTFGEYSELAGNKGVSNDLNILCSGDWVVQNLPSWIKLSSNSGTKGTTIKVLPQNNTTLTARPSTTFQIKSTLNGLVKNVTVSQRAFKFDSSSKSFSYGTLERRTDSFNILCSGEWTAKNVPSWITVNATEGKGSEDGSLFTFSLTSKPNLTASDLSQTIIIESKDNPSLQKSIALTQKKFEFSIPYENISFGPMESGFTPFAVGSSAGWRASSNADWVVPDPNTSGDGIILNIKLEKNLTRSERTAVITFVPTFEGADISSLKKELKVLQTGYILSVSESSLSAAAKQTAAMSVSVSCSGRWAYRVSQSSWISVKQTGSEGNGKIEVTVSENTTQTQRSGTITVYSLDNESITETIQLTQAAASAQ